MLTNLLAESNGEALSVILIIAIVVVSILIGVATLVALALRIKIFFNYWITNRQKTEGGYNGYTAATEFLKDLGYGDVKVEMGGFFRALFFGNHYNPNKKTIYLRRSTYYGDHLTAIGLALQKVGLVIQDKRNGSVRSRWRLQKISVFGPIFFMPIVIVGIVCDFVMLYITGGAFTGIFTLIAVFLGFIYFIAGFVLSILVLKVEGKANRETLEIIKNYNFLTPDEQEKVARVFKTYQAAYICDFLINLLELIKLILKILLNIVAVSSKNNK